MNAPQMCDFVRGRLGIRVEAATGAYLHQKLQSEQSAAVMGGDAKTGVAIRKIVSLDGLEPHTPPITG